MQGFSSNITKTDFEKAFGFDISESEFASLGITTNLQSRPSNKQNSDFQTICEQTFRNKRYASILGDFRALKALPDNTTAKKWQLKAQAEKLLPKERVNTVCMKWLGHGKHEARIVKNESGNHSYRDLQVCGSVWHCPMCASRISEIRRKELRTAVGFSGYKTLLLTFTMQHHSGDDLKNLVSIIQSAYGLFKSGRFYQELKENYRILGTIKALEVTFGENGWHPHIHVLLVVENHEIDARKLEKECRTRWLECVQKRGGWCNYTNGCTVKSSNTFVQDYVAKFGKMPSKQDWDAVSEVTKTVVKKAKRNGFSPFMLLELAARGSVAAAELFREYAKVFKGRNQLSWSRGLKALMNIDEISDLEAMEAADNDESLEVVATISAMTWFNIVATKNRSNVLIAANELSRKSFLQYLSTFEDLYLWKAENNVHKRE